MGLIFLLSLTGCLDNIFQDVSDYRLNIETVGFGTVVQDPDQNEYEKGTKVKLTAQSNEGWKFDHWEGNLSGKSNPVAIAMDEEMTITAVFKETK